MGTAVRCMLDLAAFGRSRRLGLIVCGAGAVWGGASGQARQHAWRAVKRTATLASPLTRRREGDRGRDPWSAAGHFVLKLDPQPAVRAEV